MKKFSILICVFCIVLKVNAQFFIGGSVGMGIVKQHGNESEITFKIVPEVGYGINDDWTVGLAFGYKKGSCLVGRGYYEQDVKTKAIGIQPYVRYTPIHVSIIGVFLDGCFTYENIIDNGVNMNLGLKPGFCIKPMKNINIVTHLGFIGAELYKEKNGGRKSGAAGVDIDASNLELGVFYNF